MLKSVGLKNFRSFVDKTSIELKPITVFVGKNSSGKSSFLRTFPLIRQSIERNTTGPILWYGNYVDFGDFDNVKSKKNISDDNIHLYFEFESKKKSLHDLFYFLDHGDGSFEINENSTITINLESVLHSKNKKTMLKQTKLIINNILIDIDMTNPNKIKISKSGCEINHEIKVLNANKLIPEIILQAENDVLSKNITSSINRRSRFFIYQYGIDSSFDKIREIDFIKDLKLNEEQYIKILSTVFLLETKEVPDYFNALGLTRKRTREIETLEIEKLQLYSCLFSLNKILDLSRDELNGFYNNVRYIAPLRSTSERYYRFQDLQVSEIDHTGSNLAMIINSFSHHEKKRFTDWTLHNFGFSINIINNESHYAISIESKDRKVNHNINDMGFGYSQVIPIITAIWLEIQNRRKAHFPFQNNQISFIIEQPELHLHPSYQNKLIKMMISAIKEAKKNNLNLNIIFETHSETMIETIGQSIENKINLTSDDVTILVFEKNDNLKTTITKAIYDNEGNLKNWPVGFFYGDDFDDY